jgi:HAD superfamily hydrolase (TIGR01459 family)
MSVVPASFTAHFAPLAAGYDVLLCDVWGVVHNGVAAARDPCDALARFRKQGGTVILITNAPRPGEVVARVTLDRLQVPRAAYDGIVSSGDVTHALIAARARQRVFHIGPARDLPIFEGLDAPLAALDNADYAVCSGLYDDTVETPQDYHDLIERMRARTLPMICANPDIVVERGDTLVYCAGAIADLYAAAGGTVIYAG